MKTINPTPAIELILKESINKGTPQEITVYEDAKSKQTISIWAGKQAFQYLTKTTCPILKKFATAVINAYVNAGINQHEVPGGFYESIKVLKIYNATDILEIAQQFVDEAPNKWKSIPLNMQPAISMKYPDLECLAEVEVAATNILKSRGVSNPFDL